MKTNVADVEEKSFPSAFSPNLCHFDISSTFVAFLLGQQGSLYLSRPRSPFLYSCLAIKTFLKTVHIFFLYFLSSLFSLAEIYGEKCIKFFNFLILFIAFLMRKVFHNLRKYNFTLFFVDKGKIEKLNEFLKFALKFKTEICFFFHLVWI